MAFVEHDEPPFNFLGIDEEYTEYAKARFVVLPIAYEGTASYGLGTKQGPAAIINASRFIEFYDIECDQEAGLEAGIHTLSELVFPAECAPEEMIEEVEKKVSQVVADGKIICGLGGEHSVSLGLINACIAQFPGCSVLQIDAHADLRAEYEGSPFSHACIMRHVIDRAPTVQVGIRSMSLEEIELVREKKLPMYFAHEIVHNPKWIDAVVKQLSDTVYITIDVDGLDPAIIPSTGTPEPGGLGWYDVLSLIKKVAEKKRIVGFDVVELSPQEHNHAPDFTCAKLCYKIMNYLTGEKKP